MADEQAPAGELAYAKVNLTLHLCGQRADGYHLLHSLVVFPRIGDYLTCEPASGLSLSLEGPFAEGLSAGGDNLVLQAAEQLQLAQGIGQGAALRLEKNLPIASGIGGGSSDAAAALRLLSRVWDTWTPADLALALGADVPVCTCAPLAQVMSGIGEILQPAPPLPPFWMVLVNPLVGVPTGAVFGAVKDKTPPAGPAMPDQGFTAFDDLRGWLGTQRNDLQAAAEEICPAVSEVLAALSDAPFARMSGSGATCFGLYATEADAMLSFEVISQAMPEWWIAVAPVGSAT
ncbi:MAG: 4-(cytidine 5'-diphospho)-2-C-methyl-D-erythritol kinase [Pseudomonadota bacterium]